MSTKFLGFFLNSYLYKVWMVYRDCNIYFIGPRQEKIILSKFVDSIGEDTFSVLDIYNYIG